MKLHHVAKYNFCGPTALASVFGITYDEAEAIYKDIRGQTRRIRGVRNTDTLKAMKRLLRRRGINRNPYYIEFNPREPGLRPRVRELHELNHIARFYGKHRGWVPVMIVCGETIEKQDHIMAYDHQRKRLCDTRSHGIPIPLLNHRDRNCFLYGVMVVPKEFLDG